ncbi:MAG: potassium-transporting ATPase subunit C [Thaumarchaeota archaeon]|nr:potassium-transporting ATPase subunit C [Nitrososphaerota archaeon]MCL5318902.1 potassium-transporting ATPase subunit C [Nitrososphaerota archaeon]
MAKLETEKKKERHSNYYRPVIGLAGASLLICGLFFPLLVTGLAQVLMPFQANGELVQLNGRYVGSNLIAQNFTSPFFFHPRNDSASGVDPHITLSDAYSQMSRIQRATGISYDDLKMIVNQNVEGTFWVFGSPYVNVLQLNLLLIKTYPSTYNNSG